MPILARAVLFGLGMGVATVNGIEVSKGPLDVVGGLLVVAAILWPRPAYFCWGTGDKRGTVFEFGRLGSWPTAAKVARLLDAFEAAPVCRDGLVYRELALPGAHVTARHYAELDDEGDSEEDRRADA